MTTKEEYEALVALYRAGKNGDPGKLYEANLEARRLIKADIEAKRELLVAEHAERQKYRKGVKTGVSKPRPKESTASKRLADIILRETGQKVSCASCISELAKLNHLSAVDILVQIEDIADRVMIIVKGPVEKTRVKSWICEAVEGV